MANTIRVIPGPDLQPGRVALWEIHPDHPDGEVFVADPNVPVEVAVTPEVNRRLADKVLTEVSAKPERSGRSSGSD